jgi:putative transposase
MKSQPVALLLADLGVTKTHSRPHVSNDNPFSEAQFKTLKYCPQFPERFGSLEDGRAFGQGFFPWYHQVHRHSGLRFLTPAVVHFGQAIAVRAPRQHVLALAYAAHPERFVNGRPLPADLPTAVASHAFDSSASPTHPSFTGGAYRHPFGRTEETRCAQASRASAPTETCSNPRGGPPVAVSVRGQASRRTRLECVR